MKKIAIFVEGKTEAIFVTALIEEIAGRRNVLIETRKIIGGTNRPRSVQQITAARTQTNEKYFVLIYDCGSDEQVKTRILEEHDGLTRSGYERIIGIRDVYPRYSLQDLPKLEIGLKRYVKTSLIPVHFILGVMEIEAWFLAEHSHFERVHDTISIANIANTLGFNPAVDDMTARNTPAQDLNACYGLVGLFYEKGGDPKTMAALDYSQIYIELGNRIPSIQLLNTCLDNFLT